MFNNIRQIADIALNDIDSLLNRWLPDGKRQGRDWVALNPVRNDSKIGSFRINLFNGKWNDLAINKGGGDLVSLYAYIYNLSQSEAASEIAKDIGISYNGKTISQTPEQFAERQKQQEYAEKRKAKAQLEEQYKRAVALKIAQSIYNAATPILEKNHKYLIDKDVNSYGLMIAARDLSNIKAGDLVIPLFNKNGEIKSIQGINSNGDKQQLAYGAKSHSFFHIEGKEPSFIAEGYATAATIHELTGCSVYVGFDAGNLKKVAEEHPQIKFVAADNDANDAGLNAAQATGLKIVMPPELGDWNDYAKKHGKDATLKQLRISFKASLKAEIKLAPDQLTDAPKPPEQPTVAPKPPEQLAVAPTAPTRHEKKEKIAIPRITVRESREGEIYLVASSLKGLGLEGLKEALAATDSKIGNMNPKNFTFSFAMTKEVVTYLKGLPEGAVQYFPSLDAVIHADKEVNFDNNVGWLESTGNDGSVSATIRYSYETLASKKGEEISETLKNAGMKFDRNLMIWSGSVTPENLLVLHDLDGNGIDWAQDFHDMTADVGAPKQPAEAKQENFAEPKAPDKPFEP